MLSYSTSDATEWTRAGCGRRRLGVHGRTARPVADITPHRRACDTSATHVLVYFFDAAITRVSTAVLCIRSSAEHRPTPSRPTCSSEPGPGADVAAGEPRPVQTWQRASALSSVSVCSHRSSITARSCPSSLCAQTNNSPRQPSRGGTYN
jgi:hypothetical protein